jgi:hypothetical protein
VACRGVRFVVQLLASLLQAKTWLLRSQHQASTIAGACPITTTAALLLNPSVITVRAGPVTPVEVIK